MAELHLRRRIDNISFNRFNQRLSISLPVDVAYKRLLLRCNGQIDFSGGAASGAALAEAPFSLIQNARVRANGKHVLLDLDGGSLMRLAQFEYGVKPPSSNNVTGAASNDQTFSFVLPIDFSHDKSRLRNPADLYLPASFLQTLDLEIQIGGKAEMLTGANDRTATFDSFQIEVYADVVEGFDDKLNGKILKKVYSKDVTVSATNSRELLELAAGNSFRQIVFKGELETGASHGTYDPSNDVFDSIQIFAGATEVFNALEDVIREQQEMTAFLNAAITGYYMVDFSPDGLLSQVLGTGRLRTLDIIASVVKGSNGTRLKVIPEELVALPVGG